MTTDPLAPPDRPERKKDEMPDELARSGTREIRDRQPAAVTDGGIQDDCAGTFAPNPDLRDVRAMLNLLVNCTNRPSCPFCERTADRVMEYLDSLLAPAAHQERTEPTTFEDWWARVGMFLDPDTEDVSWFDKRKELCQYAFAAAMAQSRNYVADREVCPREITFTNGRKVVFNDAWRCLDVVEAKRG